MDDGPQRAQVELVVSTRTIVVLLAVGAAVALAIVSLGILLSIFVAIVLALGLDPVVAALVRRGWRRGPAALAVFAALFVAVGVIVIVTVGPLWGEIKDFLRDLPAYWNKLSNSDAFNAVVSDGSKSDVHQSLQDLAKGLPEAATSLLGIFGGVFGAVLSLVTLTFLALFMLMERPTITNWLFGFAAHPRSPATTAQGLVLGPLVQASAHDAARPRRQVPSRPQEAAFRVTPPQRAAGPAALHVTRVAVRSVGHETAAKPRSGSRRRGRRG